MTKNLFDTRGGVAMIGRCEACHESIPDDSLTGLCRECEEVTELEHDDE